VSQFVDVCRREWDRLGVPEGVANEMAADLVADLAEAQADGVSPEVVLGNGYFDAKSFAASWAMARGVVRSPGDRSAIRIHALVLALSALVAAVVAGVGVLILARPRFGSQAMAAAPIGPRVTRPAPSILVNPHHVFFAGPGVALDPLGWVLLLVGLVGLVATLWIWRPWSSLRQGTGPDQNIGLPSFL